MNVKRKKKGIPKLNLIPILDAVFIFIFFLLMSAQFINIYEIGSDAPIISTFDQEDNKDKKVPLNLVVEVKRDQILVKTGLDGIIKKTIGLDEEGNYNLKELNKILVDIKLSHQTEKSIIIKPDNNVQYKKIVKVMDAAGHIDKDSGFIELKDKFGEKYKTKKLFDQIIFETM